MSVTQAVRPPVLRTGGFGVPRRLGLTGSLMMAVGALGAGALPVPNPLSGWRLLGLPARNATLAIALTYAGMGLLVLAWVRVALMLRETRPGPGLVRTAVTWAVPLVVAPPLFSRDVYSYLAQGAMLVRGVNPSVEGPAAGLGIGDALVRSIPTVWRDTPSPYGPLFLLLARAVSQATGEAVVPGVLAFRGIALIGLGAVVWALPRLARRCGVDGGRALWLGVANPLVLFHVISGAHNDALMLGLLLVGLEVALRAGARLLDPWLVGGAALIVGASAVKLPALLALGFLGMEWARRRGGRLRDVVAAASVLVVVTAGVDVVLSSGTGIGWEWLGALSVPGLTLSWLSPVTDLGLLSGQLGLLAGLGDHSTSVLAVSHAVGVVAAGGVCVWAMLATLRGRVDPMAGLAAGTAAVVLLGPALQPWYLLWAALPMAASRALPRCRRVLFAASAGIAFLVAPAGADFASHAYQLPMAILAAIALFGSALWLGRRSFADLRGGHPDGMLRRVRRATPLRTSATAEHFGLADPAELGIVARRVFRLLGVTPSTSGVWVDDELVAATFGPWAVRTPLRNIASAEVTGPYAAWKVAGVRLSLADRGLTFGTTARSGACLSFHEPVMGIEPTGLLRHPSLTVTVSEPELLVARIRESISKL